MEPILRIKNLTKSFDSQPVLKHINLELMSGENVVILGRSGQGKTVLLKCIVGLVKPDGGSIHVLNKNVQDLKRKELSELRKKVGFCFQGNALYDSMTIRENLEFPLRRSLGLRRSSEILEMVKEALNEVGLLHTIDKLPAELSGGMKKRIGIARTLILKPSIMLYDEPTSGLDPLTAAEINTLIVMMQQKYGVSSLIITHDLTCARHTANQLVFMKDGAIAMQGDFNEIASDPVDPILKSFFDYTSTS